MKKLISQLQNLNFTQYESRAYLSLLQQGNISGYELAKNSGIPASKIYQVLNKLMEKEVIIALDSEPVKYTPLPPNEVLSRLKGDYLNTVNNLDSKLDEIYTKQHLSNNYIWNISGRETILRRVCDFINQSIKQIYLSVWDEEVEEIQSALMEADRRNTKLSIVHYGENLLGIGTEFKHGREHQIRQQRGERRLAMEIDEEKVILCHFHENGDSNAIWTTNKGLILLAKDYIIHDIYTIRMAEKFGDAANEIFELN
ncbi:MAG: TrmB family transcriptional regulator [Calditrichia bacterium]|nr:TrmB family transcriptional regulator [Calditrichia bacterium]